MSQDQSETEIDRVRKAYQKAKESRRLVVCPKCEGSSVRNGKHGIIENSSCKHCSGRGLVLR